MLRRVEKRHLVTFALVAVGVAWLTIWGAKTSASYEEAKRFLRGDPSVLVQTGSVRNVRFVFWERFRQSGGVANYSFLVDAEKGKFQAHVRLAGRDDVWRVNEVSVVR